MASRSKRLRVLQEVYASLPPIACKGLCWRACAAIQAKPIELERMESAAGRRLERVEGAELDGGAVVVGRADLACPALVMRRCSIYEARPLICRLFGVAEGLPCPHGCAPGRVVPDVEVRAMLDRVGRP